MLSGKKTEGAPKAKGRREFLKVAGAGSAAAGAVLLGGKPASAVVADNSETGKGYRETEHVKTYYDLARF